jgi:hypothetical protein
MKKCALNKPPFKFDPKSGNIKNAENVNVFSACSFNYLRSNMKLPLAQAIKQQNIFGHIAEHLLNSTVKEPSLFGDD